jgi:site-specific recombinase XerD
MQQKRYSTSTIATYLSFVKQFFARTLIAPEHITFEVISSYNYQYFIKARKSYATQNQWINAIKLFLRVNRIDIGNLEEIERPRKQRTLPNVLSKQEVQAIFEQTPNLKHRTLLMMIYGAGLRIGEALNLTIHDIRSKESLIYIRGGKGKKDRRVPLSDKLLGMLRRYYKSYRPKRYLFEGPEGSKYSRSSAGKVLKRSAANAGITSRVTLHTLRHSYATHLTNSGINIQYLQEILGHNSPKTTMLYTHLSGKDIRNIKSPLDDMDI